MALHADGAPLAALGELVSNLGGTMLVATGLTAGGARAWAVLRKSTHAQIEAMTAIGFVAGVIVTIAIVCIDSLLELR